MIGTTSPCQAEPLRHLRNCGATFDWYDDLSTPYACARQRCVSDPSHTTVAPLNTYTFLNLAEPRACAQTGRTLRAGLYFRKLPNIARAGLYFRNLRAGLYYRKLRRLRRSRCGDRRDLTEIYQDLTEIAVGSSGLGRNLRGVYRPSVLLPRKFPN